MEKTRYHLWCVSLSWSLPRTNNKNAIPTSDYTFSWTIQLANMPHYFKFQAIIFLFAQIYEFTELTCRLKKGKCRLAKKCVNFILFSEKYIVYLHDKKKYCPRKRSYLRCMYIVEKCGYYSLNMQFMFPCLRAKIPSSS